MTSNLNTTLEEQAERGRRAQQILESPDFRAAVTLVEEGIITAWKKAKNPAERERLHAEQTALTEVVRKLRIAFERGTVAREKLDAGAKE